MGEKYIGLMSGTSMDGIDAVLVEIGSNTLDVLRTHSSSYPDALRRKLLIASQDATIRAVDDVPELHAATGVCFRDAVTGLLAKSGVDAGAITAIGSHGQTLRHLPDDEHPFSLQIGDPSIIANGTAVTTVADFRRADIELGGQGAPLAPAFHEWMFRRAGTARVVLNIGGIANITILSGNDAATTGFDTGPGNTLLDAFMRRERNESFDQDGAWAASGKVDDTLLQRLLDDPYFSAPPPKSTGFEYFNLEWLEAREIGSIDPADVQATLCALTAISIGDAIQAVAAGTSEILVCGGGVHNRELLRRLRARLPGVEIESTATAGLDPDWVEAVAFAWLAMRRLHELPGNLPAVTGASDLALLGSVTSPA